LSHEDSSEVLGCIFFHCWDHRHSLYIYVGSTNKKEDVLIFTSDLEGVSGECFMAGDYKLQGSAYQTSKYSRSGKHASLLNKDQEFGISYTFKNIKKGDIVIFSAWRLSDDNNIGHLIISNSLDDKQYVSTSRVHYYENNWGFIEAYFLAEEDIENLKMYAHNPHEEAVYFDDVTVKCYSNNTVPDTSYESLELKLDEGVFNKISSFRKEALSQGIIMKAQKEYVKASIVIHGEEVPV
jgi:hypothetical protein